MSRTKSPDTKTKEQEIQESLELAKQMRLAAAAARKPKSAAADLAQSREKFRTFWSLNRRSYGRQRELEDVLWAHLAAIGATSEDKFEEGLRHFGLKKGE